MEIPFLTVDLLEANLLEKKLAVALVLDEGIPEFCADYGKWNRL